MQQSSELFFASSNEHKFKEVQRILSNLGVNIKLFKTTLEEIQSNSLNEIAKRKAIDAFTKIQKSIIIEDDGLFAISLREFDWISRTIFIICLRYNWKQRNYSIVTKL